MLRKGRGKGGGEEGEGEGVREKGRMIELGSEVYRHSRGPWNSKGTVLRWTSLEMLPRAPQWWLSITLSLLVCFQEDYGLSIYLKRTSCRSGGGGNICGEFPIHAWQADSTVSVGECLPLLSEVSIGSRAFSEL